MTRVLGDFEAAEEVVQDALLAAWQQWPVEGVPERPGAWLWTAARRRAVDVLRRRTALRAKLAQVSLPVEQQEDDRLRLLFTCCHPALSQEAQVALTLRTVCGLSTAEVASGFLVSEAAIVQRLTRARRKIATAGIPYRVPDADELADRLSGVLAVIYLLFNEGYLCSAGEVPQRRDLTDDAQWLAALLAGLMPAEPEVLGLLALIRLHRAIAFGQVFGPAPALAEVDALAGGLVGYHLFHATRAELLRQLGRPDEARLADAQALRLTGNPAERALLEQRLG